VQDLPIDGQAMSDAWRLLAVGQGTNVQACAVSREMDGPRLTEGATSGTVCSVLCKAGVTVSSPVVSTHSDPGAPATIGRSSSRIRWGCVRRRKPAFSSRGRARAGAGHAVRHRRVRDR
jgi:hypothetical protein